MASEPDWALWRSFAAVMAEGSLSAAARRIGYSQPTIGRHIEALEQQLGIRLFERTQQGLKPTARALRYYEPVARAERALAEAGDAADRALDGVVRILAAPWPGELLLPPLLHRLRRDMPEMALEIALAPVSGLDSGGIVLATRPLPGLGQRRLPDLALVWCAHQAYLGAHGTPRAADELVRHALIELAGCAFHAQAYRATGADLMPDDFILRTDSPALAWRAIAEGIGIGLAPRPLVRDTPGLREVLPAMALPSVPLWLGLDTRLSRDMRNRALYERLVEMLTDTIGRHAARPDQAGNP